MIKNFICGIIVAVTITVWSGTVMAYPSENAICSVEGITDLRQNETQQCVSNFKSCDGSDLKCLNHYASCLLDITDKMQSKQIVEIALRCNPVPD